jgi:hypothetical protein
VTEQSDERSAEEDEVLDAVARSRGREWAEAHAALIFDQARALGEID